MSVKSNKTGSGKKKSSVKAKSSTRVHNYECVTYHELQFVPESEDGPLPTWKSYCK